jgi:hypothetical protein
MWWLKPLILVTQKAEFRRIVVQSYPQQKQPVAKCNDRHLTFKGKHKKEDRN